MSLAKRDGVELRVFLMGDAVTCAVAGQVTPNGYYNVERMIHGLTAQRLGAVGRACPRLPTLPARREATRPVDLPFETPAE